MSATDKNGADVQNDLKISADGNAVALGSLGAYAGVPGANAEVPYVARRDGSGGVERQRLRAEDGGPLPAGIPQLSRRLCLRPTSASCRS